MTKLMQWIIGAFIFLSVWLSLLLGQNYTMLDIRLQYIILFLPFYSILLFGIYSLIIILYRVFTFNDCEEAAVELQEQIKQAVVDLTSKGIRLRTKSQFVK